MHEFSIAASIVESLLDFASKQSGQVLSVRLAVGELTHVETGQLNFCYEAITQGTALEGSALEIEKVQAVVRCGHCSYQGGPKYWDDALCYTAVATLACPQCGQAVEAIEGHECAIKSVRLMR